MPAKILCPYGPEQLRAIYARKSLREIAGELTANAYPVSIKTVSKWLQDAGIERKVYSPFTAIKLESPFTPERLHELYWHEGKSLSEIGTLAGPLVGLKQRVQQATVTRWLAEAGVTLRTAAESQAVRAKVHPEQFKEGVEAMRAALTPEIRQEIGFANAERLRRVQPQGAKAAAVKKKAERPWETRACQLCGKDVTKPARLFRNPPEQTYCGKSCSSRHAALLRQLGLAPPIAYHTVEKVMLSCAECGTAIERLPGHVRKERSGKDAEHHFCSRSCISRFANRRRSEAVERVVKPCARCGKEVSRLPGQAKSDKLYCGLDCQRADTLNQFLPGQNKKLNKKLKDL